ncbi:MAG TPA: methyltransferase domain-containing protein, partial [Kiloniellaceae bacterium]
MQYPEEFIERLHLIWGAAFLSPGGPEEVREIVRGLDLEDRQVLDIGCGTGGPAIVLARDSGARVTGLDVEPQLIERARRFAG